MRFSTDDERALADRDWAPLGGTSLNRARLLQHELHRAVFDELGALAASDPQLRTIDFQEPYLGNLPRAHWIGDKVGAYFLNVGLSHSVQAPEEAMPTIVWARYSTLTGEGDCRPLDVRMTGEGARDSGVVAAMLLTALRQHAQSLGVLPAKAPGTSHR
jgi:hypothetical protein